MGEITGYFHILGQNLSNAQGNAHVSKTLWFETWIQFNKVMIMGTWAAGSFGNDAAGDWVMELRETPTYEFIRETMQASMDIPDDASVNAPAVAAAEVLCILEGKIPADYEEVSHNLEPAIAILRQQKMPNDLKHLAIECLNMIASDSELKELWEDMEEWTTEINNLKNRLQK